jgi:hypothetical protein
MGACRGAAPALLVRIALDRLASRIKGTQYRDIGGPARAERFSLLHKTARSFADGIDPGRDARRRRRRFVHP